MLHNECHFLKIDNLASFEKVASFHFKYFLSLGV